mgnify:CR=1 FL=1|tara:strand:- start:690 stop:929 length:240 start_codon:yes stop_codon:yes gene_type:complete
MVLAILTFQDIIKLNDFDWDRANAVLIFHLEKGSIQKGVLPEDQVIYHNFAVVEGHQLMYDTLFAQQPEKSVMMRPRYN